MATARNAHDVGGLINELEARVGRMERRGRGFTIPPSAFASNIIASPDEPPAPADSNTIWIDTDDGNKIYSWNGSDWVPAMDPAVDIDRNNAAVELATWQDVDATSDGIVVLYRQASAPLSGMSLGDLWVRTSDNLLFRWSGSIWEDQASTALGELLDKPALSLTVADGRVTTWWQLNPPTAFGFGDLWADTSQTPPTLHRWNNFTWVQILDWSLINIRDELDTKITTFYQDEPPTATAPGDIWFDTNDNNHQYRAEAAGANFIGPPGSSGWVSAKDGDIADVVDQVQQKIKTFIQPAPPPTSESIGDLWIDTSDSNKMYRANAIGVSTIVTSGPGWYLVRDQGIQTAINTASSKNRVFRQTTKPWPDGAAGHTGDIGDLWFDTSPGPGVSWLVVSKQLTGNVATLTTEEAHDIVVGNSVAVSDVGAPFDGSYTVTSVGPSTVSFTRTSANIVPTQVNSDLKATVQAQGVGAPLNKAYIWDGAIWNSAQDTEVTETTNTLNNQLIRQSDALADAQAAITNLQRIADGLAATAYAADGRINISDYIPTSADAYIVDQAGNQIAKNEGSLWLTRTRNRINLCSNPSFETGTTGWTVTGGTGTRQSMTDPIAADGVHVYRISGTAANNRATWAGGSPGFPVTEGQEVVASVYGRLVSGSGTNCYMDLQFLNSAGTPVGDLIQGGTANLVTTEWLRMYVYGKAPAGAAYVRAINVVNPNSGAVWSIDASLFELSNRLGAYFDGGHRGAKWLGAEEGSRSELKGGAVMRLFELNEGDWVEKFWTSDTIASVSADRIIGGGTYERPAGLQEHAMDGALIADNTISVDKQYAAYLTASEKLYAGDLVNVWDNEGLFMVQRATAGAKNMIKNASFEEPLGQGELSWTGGTVSISPNWAADGNQSLLMVSTGGGSTAFISLDRPVSSTTGFPYAMQPGRIYVFSASLRLNAAIISPAPSQPYHQIGVTYRLESDPTTYLMLSSQTPNVTGVNYEVQLKFALPADAIGAQLRLYTGSGSADHAVFWDSLSLYESDEFLPFSMPDKPIIRPANGFVLTDCGIGDPIRVYHQGYNELLTGNKPGTMFLSTVPGQVSSSSPQEVGTMVQQVGFAPNPTVLNFNPGTPITIV